MPFCFWHAPGNEEEVAEARRLGGLRRRREKTVSGAYDFEGLGSVEAIRRIVEIAVIDGLGLANSIARARVLISAAGTAAKRGDSPAGDPERNAADAARRAGRQVRRYCAANRLNRLGTLAYAGAGNHEPKALRRDLSEFFRRVRSAVGESFPYLWAPEWHPGGHGLHVHFAVGRWITKGVIDGAWGHGFTHIRLLGDLPVGSGSLGEARLAARYLAGYVGKDLASGGQPSGLHRYEVAEGYQPRRVPIHGETADEVLGWAETFMGAAPEHVWRSRDEERGTGHRQSGRRGDERAGSARRGAGVGRTNVPGSRAASAMMQATPWDRTRLEPTSST